MGNWYIDRNRLKAALNQDASSTGDHGMLDDTLESVSRLIDDYLGFHLYPSSGTRYFTPRDSRHLELDYPLLAVDAIQTSSDGGTTYGSTMVSGAYYLEPANATEESPRQPWWSVGIRPNTTASGAAFPAGTMRGARIQGTWGYFDERSTATATLATALNATSLTAEINGATAFRPGQTILMGGERMFVVQTPASATGSHSSQITVERARNGSAGATHSCATAIEIYNYPVVERAVLYQAQLDFRVKDAPLGVAGGEPFGAQSVRAAGGLHPFTLRMLAGFRMPVVR